jgi:hypothetical protein
MSGISTLNVPWRGAIRFVGRQAVELVDLFASVGVSFIDTDLAGSWDSTSAKIRVSQGKR